MTPAVAAFLKENPLVVLDRKGRMHGLIVVDDAEKVSAKMRADWEKHYFTPGLDSLRIYSVSTFATGRADIARPYLLIPIDTGRQRG